jgi:hypothetical protein
MTKLTNVKIRSIKHVLSIGLAAATLAVVLTYVLGAQALLQTPQAEPAHNLFMSIFAPLIQAITGGHSSMAQMHGDAPGSDSQQQMQRMSESQMQEMRQGTMGLIGNNILGSPKTLPAGGLAAILGLGVAKGIRTARPVAVVPR